MSGGKCPSLALRGVVVIQLTEAERRIYAHIYNLRDQSRLLQPKFNTKRYGYRSFKYFGSRNLEFPPNQY